MTHSLSGLRLATRTEAEARTQRRETLVSRLRRMAERQGEDYIWRIAKEAADEIERLTALTSRYTNDDAVEFPSGKVLG